MAGNNSNSDRKGHVPEAATKKQLIVLDFTPYDIDEALDALKALFASGDLQGLVFAAEVRSRKGFLYGSAGLLADDPIRLVGAATMLLASFTEAANEMHHG